LKWIVSAVNKDYNQCIVRISEEFIRIAVLLQQAKHVSILMMERRCFYEMPVTSTKPARFHPPRWLQVPLSLQRKSKIWFKTCLSTQQVRLNASSRSDDPV